MEFDETSLKGAFIVRVKKIEDDRGYFGRAWCCDEFLDHGLNPRMVQLNVGFSRLRGTVRGMHYQLRPHAEAKFIRCTRGAIFDVVIDLREDSPTFGQWHGEELTAENGMMIYAPEGFAHGYQTLLDDSEMYYFTSAAYAPKAAHGIRFDDPIVAIRWPLPVSLISEQDRNWPGLRDRPRSLAQV
jgi:dTDP-4-dehydrorhamnose 3,5-epimerase